MGSTAGGGVPGGFVGGLTGASNWMSRFGGSGTMSPASISPRLVQNNLGLHAGNINAEEWQLQWALDASLAGQRVLGEIQVNHSNVTDAEDDVPAPLPFEFDEGIQRKDSNALEAEDDFPDSNSTSSFVPGPNQRAWWSFVGA